MNESKRQQKVAKLLQKDLGDIFSRDVRGILENAFITISDVRVTPDLKIAYVYLSMMMVNDKEGLIDRINQRKSEIRKILGNKIGKQVRVVPDLKFYIDELGENAIKLDKLIDDLNIPPENNENNDK